MGTGCSKEVVRSSRRRRGPSLRSFCSGGCSYSLEHDDDRLQRKQSARTEPGGDRTMKGPSKIELEGFLKGEGLGTAQVSSVPSNIEFDRWIHGTASSDQSVAGNCSISPDRIGISLSRPTNIGPSEAYSLLSSNLPVSDSTTVFHEATSLGYSGSNSNVVRDSNLCAVELPWINSLNGSHRIGFFSGALQLRPSTTMVQQPDHATCTSITMPELAGNGPSLDSRSGTAHDEPMHANVPELYGLTSEVQQSAEIPQTSSNHDIGDSSIRPSSSSDQFDVGNQQPIDATDDNPSSNQMSFLERRQRVRSQVRALHSLGSPFENLVRHDRSCIMSGQHRRGRCLCRENIRTDSIEGDGNTRASISRIVMLAEALFDVLDEIHQQSVVLSSWPSVSSLGSVPAPKEVVECLPVKVYTKSNIKNEEAVQCYICLAEYEEGDCLRILPCHHMFHQSCVDKWLKEVHRVCPLCRGNICTSDSLPLEAVG